MRSLFSTLWRAFDNHEQRTRGRVCSGRNPAPRLKSGEIGSWGSHERLCSEIMEIRSSRYENMSSLFGFHAGRRCVLLELRKQDERFYGCPVALSACISRSSSNLRGAGGNQREGNGKPDLRDRRVPNSAVFCCSPCDHPGAPGALGHQEKGGS